ncbi:MAG: hypothetical protein CL450_09195, partial [Acidimicrobiaceae bacterium]|nr:hypothetical protein [Acidimicrobiaceae bacterium]
SACQTNLKTASERATTWQTQIKTLSDDLRAANGRVTALESQTSASAAGLATCQTNLKSTSERATTWQEQATARVTDLSKCTADLSKLSEASNSLTTCTENLSTSNSDLRTCNTNLAAANVKASKFTEMSNLLTECTSSLQKTIAPQPTLPACIGGSTWKSAYGYCLDYAKGKDNYQYCATDSGTAGTQKLLATEACSECGMCAPATIS